MVYISVSCQTIGFHFFYQAAKAQQEVDEDSRQLVEDLSSLLAYTAACKDLPQINGRDTVVGRVISLTKESACLIDECMAHSFVGESWHSPVSIISPMFL